MTLKGVPETGATDGARTERRVATAGGGGELPPHELRNKEAAMEDSSKSGVRKSGVATNLPSLNGILISSGASPGEGRKHKM